MKTIEQLEDEIVELKFSLEKYKDKEFIYFAILNEINSSLNDVLKFKDEMDCEYCLKNLKKNLDEYKRIYKIDF